MSYISCYFDQNSFKTKKNLKSIVILDYIEYSIISKIWNLRFIHIRIPPVSRLDNNFYCKGEQEENLTKTIENSFFLFFLACSLCEIRSSNLSVTRI